MCENSKVTGVRHRKPFLSVVFYVIIDFMASAGANDGLIPRVLLTVMAFGMRKVNCFEYFQKSELRIWYIQVTEEKGVSGDGRFKLCELLSSTEVHKLKLVISPCGCLSWYNYNKAIKSSESWNWLFCKNRRSKLVLKGLQKNTHWVRLIIQMLSFSLIYLIVVP